MRNDAFIRRRLFDPQEHAGAAGQFQLALGGGQDDDAERFRFSGVGNANVGEAIGTARVRRKNPHGLRSLVVVDYAAAASGLIGAGLNQYAIPYGLSDECTVSCVDLASGSESSVATDLRCRYRRGYRTVRGYFGLHDADRPGDRP